MDECIGIIGVRLLGSALASRLRAARFHVCGYDVDPSRTWEGEAAESPADVASRCRRVLLSLPHSGIAAQVLDDIEPHLLPDAIVIDTTTGDPDEMAAFGNRLSARGVHYLDATVAGSSRQVAQGEAVIM